MAVFSTGGIAPPSYGPPLFDNFADNEWSAIIWACQTGNVPESWAVGNQKPMPINGTSYPIDIIGKWHDDYSDGSGKAPLTFQMHDCYITQYQMNNISTNDWENCKMRTTHLPAIMALMPPEVQSGIRSVNKLVSVGNQSSTIKTTADKLFLLSEVEVLGSLSLSFPGEGSRYAYYAAGNSAVKKRNGATWYWWGRSPSKAGSDHFCYINTAGQADHHPVNNTADGTAFAFCF